MATLSEGEARPEPHSSGLRVTRQSDMYGGCPQGRYFVSRHLELFASETLGVRTLW